MPAAKKVAAVAQACVACGCCGKVCPKGAIRVYKGVRAVVGDACIGCGKCAKACPAGVIAIREVEACEEAVV